MYAVESLCEVYGDCGCAEGGLWVVEATSDSGSQWNQGRGRGVKGFEAVLRGVSWEDAREEREEEALQDLACRA